MDVVFINRVLDTHQPTYNMQHLCLTLRLPDISASPTSQSLP